MNRRKISSRLSDPIAYVQSLLRLELLATYEAITADQAQ